MRIFKALKPDIVLINEFVIYKYNIDSPEHERAMIDTTFGPEYYYYKGEGMTPNGIISRYPIKRTGSWTSTAVSNRTWDWAVIDLQGTEKDLLAVSVHLSTTKNADEMMQLVEKVKEKIAADGVEYYLVIGGDFNTKAPITTDSNMGELVVVGDPYPVDQDNIGATNASRQKFYDYLLCSEDWGNLEVPITIGAHTYHNGHVFDSRVYDKYDELQYVQPVQSNDSGANNMQHMAVIRDFSYSY